MMITTDFVRCSLSHSSEKEQRTNHNKKKKRTKIMNVQVCNTGLLACVESECV